jgi:hypothetical protein
MEALAGAAAAEQASRRSALTPAPASTAGAAAEEAGAETTKEEEEDACAACGFGITGNEPAVRALQGLYHPECFRCATCGAALLPPSYAGGAASPSSSSSSPRATASLAEAAARELRRVRLGSLDGAEGAGPWEDEGDEDEGEEEEEEEEEEDGGHLTFLQLNGRPLCRQHFRAQLLALQEGEGGTTTAPAATADADAVAADIASPPASAFATPDRARKEDQTAPSPSSSSPSPAPGDDDDGSYATASAPTSPAVRFAPVQHHGGGGGGDDDDDGDRRVEGEERSNGSRRRAALPSSSSIFHSADGVAGVLWIPPPVCVEGEEGGQREIWGGGSEPSPTSLARLRRSKSATTLRGSGRQQQLQHHSHRHQHQHQHQHHRRGSHAHPLLSVAAHETAAERDARLLRRRASQALLFGEGGEPGALFPPLPFSSGKQPQPLSQPQSQPPVEEQGEGGGGGRRLSPPPRRPPLTTATALAYGVQVVVLGEGGRGEKGEEEEELGKEAFAARRQLELRYSSSSGGNSGGNDETDKGGGGEEEEGATARGAAGAAGAGAKPPVSFFWEEAAPAVFARVRRLFGVPAATYAAALASLEEEGKVRGGGGGGCGGGGGGGCATQFVLFREGRASCVMGPRDLHSLFLSCLINDLLPPAPPRSVPRMQHAFTGGRDGQVGLPLPQATARGRKRRHRQVGVGRGGEVFAEHLGGLLPGTQQRLLDSPPRLAQHPHLSPHHTHTHTHPHPHNQPTNQVVLHRSTLLPRFLGLYRIKLPGKPPTRLLAQRNVFALPTPQLRLRERYDLKGSLIRRLAAPPANSPERQQEEREKGKARAEGPSRPAAARATSNGSSSSSSSGSGSSSNGSSSSTNRVPVQKDLAFCRAHDGTDDAGHGVKAEPGAACRVVRLGAERKKQLLSFLAADVEWLRRRNVVDYSLLLGCATHRGLNTNPWARRGAAAASSSLAALLPGPPDDEEARHRLYSLWLPSPEPEPAPAPTPALGCASSPLASPSSVAAASSSIYHTEEAFLIGLVDILQTFTLKRRLEVFVKTGVASLEGNDPEGLSIVDPATYARRFIAFLDQHTA